MLLIHNNNDVKERLNIFLTYTAPESTAMKHFQRKNHLII